MPDILDPDAWRRPWSGPLAPYGRTTGDRREFVAGQIDHRDLPLPLLLQVTTADGHRGSVGVGRITGITYTDGGVFGTGDWFSPAEVPEVRRALALVAGRVVAPSVDIEPDMEVEVREPDDGGKPILRYRRARIIGATLVYMPAFGGLGIALGPVPDTDEEPGEEYRSFALTGTSTWRSMPVAPREAEFNADAAIKRILAWADGNDARARSMFLWMDPAAAEGTRDRYRLPVGDVVNGRPMLFFHAVYAAAALVSGAHGGLPTVSDQEKARLRETISAIYKRMAGVFGDPGLEAPWDKRAKMPDTASLLAPGELEAAAALLAAGPPVAPPAAWFADPKLPGPTPMTVGCDGRVFGHLATWGTCHRSVGQMTGSCVTPPESRTGYRHFATGTVLTAEGETVRVGRVTVGTGHADLRADAVTAAAHYDNTGTCAAVVSAGEDEHGIWLSGSLVPEATAEQAALLRRSPLSGDWRRPPGARSLELVAALAVNVPGFPVLRTEGGGRFALIASGITPEVHGGQDGSDGDGETVTAPQEPDTSEQESGGGVQAGPDSVIDVDAVAARAAGIVEQRMGNAARLAAVGMVERDRRAARLAALGKG